MYLLSLARKNNHRFPSVADENQHLLHNYPATYTGLKGSAFHEWYLFKSKTDDGLPYSNTFDIRILK